MLLWRCDLCDRLSESVMPRALVWPDGLTRGVQRMRQPSEALDVCRPCLATLSRHLSRRGEARRQGGNPRCAVCDVPAVGLVRVVESGRQTWSYYDWTGHLCAAHLAPLRRRARGTRKYGVRRRERVES